MGASVERSSFVSARLATLPGVAVVRPRAIELRLAGG